MKPKMEAFKAWVIDLKPSEKTGFAGRYYWYSGTARAIPIHMEGCRIAMFENREIARTHAAAIRKNDVYPNARVVRVEVVVRTIRQRQRRRKYAYGFGFPIINPSQIRTSWAILHSHYNAHLAPKKKKLIASRIAKAWREQIDPKGPPRVLA